MNGPQDLRLGDTERESAAHALGEHFAAGRLDSEEYDERVGRVWSARVRGDLGGLFDDLPGGPPPGLAVGPPAPPVAGVPREHWVAGPSAWQRTGRASGRAVVAGASRMPTWLVVVAAIVLVPLVIGLVASAMPFILAGTIAWYFLAGPGSCGGRARRGPRWAARG